MTQENIRECNPDNVVCQMEVLRHLKGLEEQLGNETFLARYPQLAASKEQISEDVKKQETVVQEAIDECGKEEGSPAATESQEEAEEPEANAEPGPD